MMGKLKAILPFALSLVVALATSYYIYTWLQQKTSSQPTKTVMEKVETIPVAVAVVNLQWGTKLSREMIKLVPFLKESLPAGHLSDISAVVDRVLIAQVQPNEPILESKLAPTSVTTGGIAAVVKPGKRAVAVKGDKVIGLAGLVHPGNRVDVLMTFTDPKNKKELTKLVLQDTLVLATGTQYEDQGKGKKPAPVDVYTLEVTPEEGEKLALASTMGKLQLALRNAADTETILTTGANIPKALSSFLLQTDNKPIPKGPGPKKEVQKAIFTVEIIRGTHVSEIKY